MIARIMIGAILMLAATTSVLAAPPFPPVHDSFEGTRFRGVALGQSRSEVEAALAVNGFRCLTSQEFPYGPRVSDGWTVCPIVRSDFVVDNISRIDIMVRYDLQQKLGLPYHAVSFVDDVASAITLDPDYFNSSGTSPYSFAEQIVANYGVVGEMTSYGSGWRGLSANDELIMVHVYPIMNTQAALLVVTAATEATTPTFN